MTPQFLFALAAVAVGGACIATQAPINARLAVQDLERVDHTIRTLGMIDSPTYGTAGSESRIPGGVPLMLNTSA